MNDKERTRCCVSVLPEGEWHPHQCTRKGKFVEGGKHYCKTHLPSGMKKRDQEAEEKYKKEWDEKYYKSMATAACKKAGITYEQLKNPAIVISFKIENAEEG